MALYIYVVNCDVIMMPFRFHFYGCWFVSNNGFDKIHIGVFFNILRLLSLPRDSNEDMKN